MSASESRWVSWAHPRRSLVREGKEDEEGLEEGVGLVFDVDVDPGTGEGTRCASTYEMGYALRHGSNVNVDNVGEVHGDVSKRASSEGDMSTSRM